MLRMALRRSAFTLIELLVVISIVGLLVSMTMPAVQSAREAARVVECSNHIRQLALAIQSHESRLQRIPSNGGDKEDSFLVNSAGIKVPIRTNDLQIGQLFRWGVGKPGVRPQDQPGSWAYAILPDIEQGSAYEQVQVESAGPLFACPSRSRGGVVHPVNDVNGEYQAGERVWAKTDYAGNGVVIQNRPTAMAFRDITDGLSHTILIGEKSFDPTVQTPSSWYWDEPIFSGGSRGTVRSGLLIQPDQPGIEYKHHWGSPHAGFAIFAMLDGSTRQVSREVDWQVFRSSLSPQGGEVESLPTTP